MPDARTLRITLEYDGTDFSGWQRQAQGERTVQGCLEGALAELAERGGPPVTVMGSGRTDAGVHAQGQVASVTLATRLAPAELRRALNAKLPPDMAVLDVALAPEGFDARRSATGKCYRYAIWNGAERSPLRARRYAFVPLALDLAAMQQAAAALVGEHDFAAFQAAGSEVAHTTRALRRAEVAGEPGGEVQLEFEASGFLRHMVRNLAGTLIEVGQGRRSVASVGELLAARDRRLAGPTAPARGLTLLWVAYPHARGGSIDSALESGA